MHSSSFRILVGGHLSRRPVGGGCQRRDATRSPWGDAKGDSEKISVGYRRSLIKLFTIYHFMGLPVSYCPKGRRGERSFVHALCGNAADSRSFRINQDRSRCLKFSINLHLSSQLNVPSVAGEAVLGPAGGGFSYFIDFPPEKWRDILLSGNPFGGHLI